MRRIILLFTVFFFTCTSEDVTQQIVIPESKDINIYFDSALQTVIEGQSLEIKIDFAKETSSAGFIEITSSGEAIYDEDFNTIPALSNGKLRITYPIGTKSISFVFQSLVDEDIDKESLQFNIANASAFIKYDVNAKFTVSITDQAQSPPSPPTDLLTIVTWNIEYFPKNGKTTVRAVRDIILNMDADVIALQEINDKMAFEELVDELPGWEGELYDVRGVIELGYLYKISKITSFSSLRAIYHDNRNAFPRQPVIATIVHSNGLEVTLIDLHLKCCGEGEKRREIASTLLKTYLDTNMPTQNVIVLGDLNDDIQSGSPFTNFINDRDHYYFVDTHIANGSRLNWSYPSWPSHLDHILITNELVDNFVSSETLRLDTEVSGYTRNVSDHRPVLARFRN